MITAAQRCGCPSKDTSLLTPEPSSKNAKLRTKSNSFDRAHHRETRQSHGESEDSRQTCRCSIQSKAPPELPWPEAASEKSSPRSNAPRPREKLVSEIAGTGLPYKEIEAIINNNRMVLRIQKLPIREEWDPPCECGTGNAEEKQYSTGSGVRSASSKTSGPYGEDVVFGKAEEEDSKPSSVRQERTVEPGGSSRRTITVVSHPDSENGPPGVASPAPSSEDDRRERREKIEPTKVSRSIDLEENPNLFILKIRKKSESAEGRENIDLEFRTPRPWQAKPRVVGETGRRRVDGPSLPEGKLESVDEGSNGKEGAKEKKENGKKAKKGKKGKK